MVKGRKDAKYEALQTKLNMLKGNREILSREALNSPRYRKAYSSLKSEINTLIYYMRDTELSRIRVSGYVIEHRKDEFVETFRPYWKRICHAAYGRYSVDEMIEIWDEYQMKAISEFGAIVDLSYLIDMQIPTASKSI